MEGQNRYSEAVAIPQSSTFKRGKVNYLGLTKYSQVKSCSGIIAYTDSVNLGQFFVTSCASPVLLAKRLSRGRLQDEREIVRLSEHAVNVSYR